jgi:hypothetical protein
MRVRDVIRAAGEEIFVNTALVEYGLQLRIVEMSVFARTRAIAKELVTCRYRQRAIRKREYTAPDLHAS